MPLAMGVEIYNSFKGNEMEAAKMDKVVNDNDTNKLMDIAISLSVGIYDSLAASIDTTFNMSIMKGIKNLIGNPQGFSAGLAQLPQSYATQFVPTVANQVAGIVDPTVRQSYVDDNLPASLGASVVSRVPFLSKMLEPKQTPFGEDVQRIKNPLGRAAAQMLSLGTIAVDQKIDPVIDKELRRLSDMGYTNQLPTMVDNYINKTQKHPRINLTQAETTAYQKRVGQLTLASFKVVLNKDKYRNARDNERKNKTADEIRADMLADAIADAKAQAKEEILEKKGY